eukprot:m.98136 g.98136  ORF g.98136 m.98136 type:complete len:121 (+) comp16738_c0_seq8:116-478(+)
MRSLGCVIISARVVCRCMGGRAAEERILGKENTTSGASSDLEQATRIARAMVTKYGFSDKIGPISVEPEEMSGKLSEMVDSEVKRLCQVQCLQYVFHVTRACRVPSVPIANVSLTCSCRA